MRSPTVAQRTTPAVKKGIVQNEVEITVRIRKRFITSKLSALAPSENMRKKTRKRQQNPQPTINERKKLFPIFLSVQKNVSGIPSKRKTVSSFVDLCVKEKVLSETSLLKAKSLSVEKKQCEIIDLSENDNDSLLVEELPINFKRHKKFKCNTMESVVISSSHVYLTRSKLRKCLKDDNKSKEKNASDVMDGILLDIQTTNKSVENKINAVKYSKIRDQNCHDTCPSLDSQQEIIVIKEREPRVEKLPFPLITHCQQYVYHESLKIKINSDCDILYDTRWRGSLGLIDDESVAYLKSKYDSEKVEILSEFQNISTETIDLVHDDKVQSVHVNSNLIKHNSSLQWTTRSQDTEFLNSPSVKILRSWLCEWKSKCLNERENHDYVDFLDSEDVSSLEKAYIITGFPGIGKTSIVNFLATELGFTVLEVNASSIRSSRHITSQLQEAFQSYHVENMECKTDYNSGEINSASLPDLTNISNPKSKIPLDKNNKEFRNSTKVAKGMERFLVPMNNKESAPSDNPTKNVKDIRGFFNSSIVNNSKTRVNDAIHNDTKKNNHITSQNEKGSRNNALKDMLSCSKSKLPDTDVAIFKNNSNNNSSDVPLESSKKISSLTLILFDDVDVVFDEDEGFWSAVNMFLKTSKKPVLFTASRSVEIVLSNLAESVEILNFNTAAGSVALSCISAACEVHLGIIPEKLDVFVDNYMNDIRRCLLHLQFWYENNKAITAESEAFLTQNRNCIGSLYPHYNQLQKVFSDGCLVLLNDIMKYHSCGIDVLYDFCFHTVPDETFPSRCTVDAKEINIDLSKNENSKHLPGDILHCMSSILDDFSFTDVLKVQLSAHSLCGQSTRERIRKWSDGIPTFNEDIHAFSAFFDLEIVSLLNIMSIRKGTFIRQSTEVESDFKHAINHNSNDFESKIKQISSVIPINQRLGGLITLLDYFDAVKLICYCENLRFADKSKHSRRFLHYFDTITLFLNPLDFA